MNTDIIENINKLEGIDVLSLLKGLEIESYNFKKVVAEEEIKEDIDKDLQIQLLPQPTKYIALPKGNQIRINPDSIEAFYPEAIVTDIFGNKNVRLEVVLPLLIQAINELNVKLEAVLLK